MPSTACHHCGAPVTIDEPVARDAECPACGRDLRCCRNCRHHDPSFHNQCREPEADPIEDRDRRNFCEFFSYSRAPFAAKGASGAAERDARARLEALFGGPPAPPGPTPSARDKLESLFKKKPDGK